MRQIRRAFLRRVRLLLGMCLWLSVTGLLHAQGAPRVAPGTDPADLLPDTRKSGAGTLPYGPASTIRPAPGEPSDSLPAAADGGSPSVQPASRSSAPSQGAVFVGPPAPSQPASLARSADHGDQDAPPAFPSLPRPQWLTPEQVVALQSSGLPVLLIDGRETVDYYAGHIPGALHLPWRALTTRGCGLRCGTLDPDMGWLQQVLQEKGMIVPERGRIVVYGGALDGWGEEGRAFWTLEYLGAEHVALLAGGYPRWKSEGRPVARLSAPATTGKPFKVQPRDPLLVTRGELKFLMKRPDVLLLDVRDSEEFHGTRKLELGRAGHIPGAVNLPWKQVFSADGLLKPEAELRALLTALKITPEHHIIVYCSGGVRSAMMYAVLRTLGYPRVTNYAGSVWDWNEDPSLPLEDGT